MINNKKMNTKNNLKIVSFYRFIKINNKRKIKFFLENYLKDKVFRGTIILANEGINASISAEENDLNLLVKEIKLLLGIRKLNIKTNRVKFLPFNKVKVKLKKEIVSLGKSKIDIKKYNGKLINPSEWNNVILDKKTKVIDVRNIFEIEIGKFQNSINPGTNSFREFPEKFKQIKISKDTNIAMYCTGGIRCEKASSFLKMNGYKNIVQLRGGILNYLKYLKNNKKDSLWKGDCFVFDNRVTVNKNLDSGKYLQCFGCRRPITKNDTKSFQYEKGVSCPYCFTKRSQNQMKRSKVRQQQIDIANSKRMRHSFEKIREV